MIDMEAEKPELEKQVLLFVENHGFTTGSIEQDEDGFIARIGNDFLNWDYHFNCGISFFEITHWCYLPELVSPIDDR